jgi:hypothetical protein
VFNDATHTGISPSVPVFLTLSMQGSPVTFTTITANGSGSYSFANLIPGTYSVSAGLAPGFKYHSASVGTGMDSPSDNGMVSGDHTIVSINVDSDDHGINYDFSELPLMQQTYTINVTVVDLTGLNLPWTVTLTDTTTNTTQSVSGMGNSAFSFSSLAGGEDYSVMITSIPAGAFQPPMYSFSNLSMDQLATFTAVTN